MKQNTKPEGRRTDLEFLCMSFNHMCQLLIFKVQENLHNLSDLPGLRGLPGVSTTPSKGINLPRITVSMLIVTGVVVGGAPYSVLSKPSWRSYFHTKLYTQGFCKLSFHQKIVLISSVNLWSSSISQTSIY